MNSILIHGRLTRDPELKTVQTKEGDRSICSFSVAVDRSFGEETDFFNCKMWGKRGEAVGKFFVKGQEIVVRGEMQCRKYKNKEDESRTVWELAATDFDFCGKKGDSPAGPRQNSVDGGIPDDFELINDDDMPF